MGMDDPQLFLKISAHKIDSKSSSFPSRSNLQSQAQIWQSLLYAKKLNFTLLGGLRWIWNCIPSLPYDSRNHTSIVHNLRNTNLLASLKSIMFTKWKIYQSELIIFTVHNHLHYKNHWSKRNAKEYKGALSQKWVHHPILKTKTIRAITTCQATKSVKNC